MSLEYWAGSLLTLAIISYLVCALVKPERF